VARGLTLGGSNACEPLAAVKRCGRSGRTQGIVAFSYLACSPGIAPVDRDRKLSRVRAEGWHGHVDFHALAALYRCVTAQFALPVGLRW